jgi:cyclophilin family peptidyl-prolyl cis-trans isomerase/HEAT repeat protein
MTIRSVALTVALLGLLAAAGRGQIPLSAQGRGVLVPVQGGQRGRGPVISVEDRRALAQDLARSEADETFATLTSLLNDPSPLVRREAANSLAQRLIHAQPSILVDTAVISLQARLAIEMNDADASRTMLRAMGELPLNRVKNFDIETFLREEAGPHLPDRPLRRLGAVEGLEALIRHGLLPNPKKETLDLLEMLGTPTVRSGAFQEPLVPAFLALKAAGALRPPVIRSTAQYHCRGAVPSTCGWQIRRLAAQAVDVADDSYDDVLRSLVKDPAFQVRLETVRIVNARLAIQNDCQLIVDALDDEVPAVAAEAYGALDPRCDGKDKILERLKQDIAPLSDRDKQDTWFLPVRAYLALARLSPSDGRNLLPGVAGHTRWPVRAAAATAAGLLRVEPIALALTRDNQPKVRAEAMTALRRIDSKQLPTVAREEFDRLDNRPEGMKPPDVGTLWVAATALKGNVQFDDFNTLMRLLKLPETSRMARLAALDRIGELGTPDASGVSPLKDYVQEIQRASGSDGPVRCAVGNVIEIITGVRRTRPCDPSGTGPMVMQRRIVSGEVLMTMARGDEIIIELYDDVAPATFARMLYRMEDRNDAYRGTTFHRLLPNTLIQGGSLDGTDWAASPCEMNSRPRSVVARGSGRSMLTGLVVPSGCTFWKDEFNAIQHERGTIALATNGTDTGIGQFFINLVDQPAFNHEYTVIGRVACTKAVRPVTQRNVILSFPDHQPHDDALDLIDLFVEGEEIGRMEWWPPKKIDRKGFTCSPTGAKF